MICWWSTCTSVRGQEKVLVACAVSSRVHRPLAGSDLRPLRSWSGSKSWTVADRADGLGIFLARNGFDNLTSPRPDPTPEHFIFSTTHCSPQCVVFL